MENQAKAFVHFFAIFLYFQFETFLEMFLLWLFFELRSVILEWLLIRNFMAMQCGKGHSVYNEKTYTFLLEEIPYHLVIYLEWII